jgi:hypothetical protein
MRPSATCVCGLQLLVYEAFTYLCMRPSATCVCGLQLLAGLDLGAVRRVYLNRNRLYHMSTYLCGNMQVRVKASFGMAVLQPTYWHWLFVAIYGLPC